MLNKVEGGNYHGFNNDHYHHLVNHSVRRRRRLLLDETTVGLTNKERAGSVDPVFPMYNPKIQDFGRGSWKQRENWPSCCWPSDWGSESGPVNERGLPVSYTHLRAHETRHDLV